MFQAMTRGYCSAFEKLNHLPKGFKVGKVTGLVVFWEKGAVPKAVVENCLVGA